MKTVKSGDTILLAKGTYADLDMAANKWNANLNFTSKVTIASEDPNNPAVLNNLMMRQMQNVELRGIKFQATKVDAQDFWVENGRNVQFVDCSFVGKTKDGLGSGIGLRIKNSNDVTVDDSDFSTFRNGLYATNGDNVDVSDSNFRLMSNDSILMGGMSGTTISGNDFRNMKSDPNLKHKDAIQFLTSSTDAPSRDIVIRNNVIDNGEQTHGIYFTNSVASGGDLSVKYRNILIEGNELRTAHTHGITMNHGDGVIIRNNTLVQNPDKGYTEVLNVPRINVSTLSTNVTITGNEVASVQQAANSTWTVSGNTTTRSMQHWSGIDATEGPQVPAVPPGNGGGGGGGDAQEFRVHGQKFAPTTTLNGFDLDDGDKIVFNFFEADTFRQISDGNPVDVFNGGRAVKIDDVKDLVEIVQHSADVTAVVRFDNLILEIDQDRGDGQIRLIGLGHEYDALL